MKKLKTLALALAATLMLAGCASTGQAPAAQVAYTQACAAYGVAFAGALQVRKAGKLNQAQIDQVTLVRDQITPICTGPLPADTAVATQQITAAVTALTILETVK